MQPLPQKAFSGGGAAPGEVVKDADRTEHQCLVPMGQEVPTPPPIPRVSQNALPASQFHLFGLFS